MAPGMYILKDGGPVLSTSLWEWADWMENADEERQVAWTEVSDIVVSTVFLGLDQNFLSPGPPILYETLVFGGELNKQMERYSTREEAEAGHARMVERVKEAI